MILTDASVVIEQQQRPTGHRRRVIKAHSAAVCGVTVAEVLTGTRNAAEVALVQNLLADFRRLAIPDALWDQVGLDRALLQARGLSFPFPDVALASIAASLGLELWTYDAHFARMAAVLPGLKLFHEPP